MLLRGCLGKGEECGWCSDDDNTKNQSRKQNPQWLEATAAAAPSPSQFLCKFKIDFKLFNICRLVFVLFFNRICHARHHQHPRNKSSGAPAAAAPAMESSLNTQRIMASVVTTNTMANRVSISGVIMRYANSVFSGSQ